MTTTVIREAAWIVAWDGTRHVYRHRQDVAFSGGSITYVGPRYTGSADRVIDGRDRFVLPGMINLHAHPASEPANRGLTEEVGSRQFWMSSLYEYLMIIRPDAVGASGATQVGHAELLRSGCTTVVDIAMPYPGWLETVAKTGIRAYLAPQFRSGRWYTDDGRQVKWDLDEKAGEEAFRAALDIVAAAERHPSGRLKGVVSPAQIDTCTEGLMRAAVEEARTRGLPITTHAAQSVVEFQEIFRRHGTTPVGWLERLGFLGPSAFIGHGIFLDHHPKIEWPDPQDLRRLADSGTTVAHAPTVFLRRGVMLHDFGRYRGAGVNVGVGTDTHPLNMLEELRTVCLAARAAARDVAAATAAEAFTAATIGGARALGRDDLGRLAVGAKADLFLADLTHPAMRPARDPLRSLVFSAADRAVTDVFVDGTPVVEGGRVLTVDLDAAHEALAAGQQRSTSTVAERDWARRDIDRLCPMSFPVE